MYTIMSIIKDSLHAAQNETDSMLKNCGPNDALMRAQLHVMRWNIRCMISIVNCVSKLYNRGR